MKKKQATPLKLFCFLVVILLIGLKSNAQKLPNVQTTGVFAPANIKIDGKATEWDNQFQAYNHAIDIFYTISNDDTFLYVVVQATDPDIINKIYVNGLTFSIDSTGKKSSKKLISITYPVYNIGDRFRVSLNHKPAVDAADPISVAKADSFIKATNMLMAAKAKYIRTSGLKDVDTLLSVYNENGIKAASQFNYQLVYTLEIAIGLKNLGFLSNPYPTFSYQLSLKGLKGYQNFDNVDITYKTDPVSGRQTPWIRLNGYGGLYQVIATAQPTDFWGDYTLVKK